MKIGELSAQSETSVQAIRLYEKEGLIPPPRRTAGGFRLYDAEHCERLKFIRQCRSADLSLEEIRELLDLRVNQASGSEKDVVARHLMRVRSRVEELTSLEQQLQDLAQRTP